MNPSTRHRATRDARRWQIRVREAEAKLLCRIARMVAGLDYRSLGNNRVSMLTHLRQRLGRIIIRHGSILD